MLLLDVPFEEKEEAKRLGARWDASTKQWYMIKYKNYHKAMKWLNVEVENTLINMSHLYILKNMTQCHNCKHHIVYPTLAIKEYADPEQDYTWFMRDHYVTCSEFRRIPSEFLETLKEYGFRWEEDYMVFNGEHQLNFRCPACHIDYGFLEANWWQQPFRFDLICSKYHYPIQCQFHYMQSATKPFRDLLKTRIDKIIQL